MKRTVFYIKPNEKISLLFQSVVNELAKPCNGPSFSPHLTFYTGMLAEDESPQKALKESIKNMTSFLLKPKEIEFGDSFTRSFYLSFEFSEVLQGLNSKLKAQIKYPEDYELKPHLSLAYTSIPVDRRRNLAEKIKDFDEPILFDRAGVLQTPDNISSFKDIQNSISIATFSLES